MPGATFTHACLALIALAAWHAAPVDAAESFSAKIEGRQWTATRTLVAPSQFGGKPVLNINGFLDAKTPSRFSINVYVPGANDYKGSFAFGQGSPMSATHGSFVANAGADANPLEDNYTFKNGALTIDVYNAATHRISGTFAGTVRNHAGKSLTISDGRFADVEIAPAAAP